MTTNVEVAVNVKMSCVVVAEVCPDDPLTRQRITAIVRQQLNEAVINQTVDMLIDKTEMIDIRDCDSGQPLVDEWVKL